MYNRKKFSLGGIKMKDWNPQLYLKFEKQRTRPVQDLIARIEKMEPECIIDIGCGPGNSTRALQQRWPDATITGLDRSLNMINQASSLSPDLTWIHSDATKLEEVGTYDVVFSNAAIQWIPDHERLIPELFALVNEGGALAVQIPVVNKMPMQIALRETAKEDKWAIDIGDDAFTIHDTSYYYDLLSKLSNDIDLWKTDYYHVMESHHQIIEWYRSTGMKPYLERIHSEDKRREFMDDILHKIEQAYSVQEDGRVLFPFSRLFFIAYK